MATKQVVVKKKTPKALEPFGDSIPHAEPAWYQGFASPYYRASHIELRNKIRKFMEEEVIPFQEEWIEKGAYPKELHRRVYELGISGIIYPKEYGGTPPADYDAFHEQILWDELGRCGGGGVLGQLSINSMALPPIIHYGSKYLKDLVLRDVIEGRKSCALMISEPTAGSDVSNIKATARREGDYYVINGEKKWITGGHMADFFTALVRTGGEGPAGLSVVVIPRDTPGISIRKMKTQFDSCHGTTFVILEDVKVPVQNLVGKEGMGAAYLMINFNHERLARFWPLVKLVVQDLRLTRFAGDRRRCPPQLPHLLPGVDARGAHAQDVWQAPHRARRRQVPPRRDGAPNRGAGGVRGQRHVPVCARRAGQYDGSAVRFAQGASVQDL